MKKYYFSVIIIVTAFLQVQGQEFKKRFVTPLDEKLQSLQVEWVTMDTDTLMDVVVAGIAVDGQLKIVPYQNLNTTSYLVKKPIQLTAMKSGTIQVADWNRDNRLDLIVSGKTLVDTDATFCFASNGNYTFVKLAQKILDHSGVFRIADMNNDAIPDLITVGGSGVQSFIRVYQNSGTELTQIFELKGVIATDISVFDMNNDGLNDIIASGHDQQSKPVTSVLFGSNEYKFTRKNIATPLDGKISLADVNDDGLFDPIGTGKNANSEITGQVWLNHSDTLILSESYPTPQQGVLFTGDMTSDGKSDYLLSGLNADKKKMNYVRELSGTTAGLDTTGLILQRMGDQDRDGDLDLVQVIDSIGSQWIKFYENVTIAVNHRPKTPENGFAISTFNKTFIFWDAPTDDHTATGSLTYDVWLGTNQSNLIVPSYNLGNARRMVVKHGNAGTNKSMIINGLTDNRYFYGIQAVDNAYNGSYEVGTGGVSPCFDLTHEDVQACMGSTVKLAGVGNTTWYSLSQGLLGRTDTLKFVASVNDTIFSFTPQQLDCSKHKVFVLHVNPAPPSDKQTIYACKNKTIQLEIAAGWSSITWDTNPIVKDLSSINFTVTKQETITVTAKSQGCEYKKEFILKVSEPTVSITGDGFQIMKGNSVQLEATGTVALWQWAPPTGLSNSTISNPVASPATTTEYVVTGTDSVGCTATATTHVLVQETAFVPNLFTPNGDGKNDNLMIYGLTSSSKFDFRIFNREGSMVYETKDILQATTTGWNGFKNGTQQPSGIYYWKVDGQTSDGGKLLLNGKSTGSILLVH